MPESKTEWVTELEVSGTYDGPTDFVASRGYRIWWTHDEARVLERGVALLERSSGELVASEWESTIESDARRLNGFPRSGQVGRITISPFAMDGNTMTYEWKGSMETMRPYPTFGRSLAKTYPGGADS